MFVVEREGEMPESSVSQAMTAMHPNSGQATPIASASGSLPKSAHLSSFPSYETPDDTRTSTPEPIKVVRSKKVAGGDKEKKKKKRSTASTIANA